MAECHSGGPKDSTPEGPPLDVLAQLTGGPRIDDLLSRAARRAPGRLALSGPSRDLTYGALEERATRCAAALRELAGGPGAVVGIAAVLDTSFAEAYGAVRVSRNGLSGDACGGDAGPASRLPSWEGPAAG
jgi:long-chain acyl-CoA synthetase